MVIIKQAVILAGGRGTRLSPLTDSCPKPMLPVEGTPFIDILIRQLANQGISHVVLLTGYLGNQIQKHVQDGSCYGISVVCSRGEIEFDTGKRLKNAESLLQDHFLLLYGDNYWEGFDLKALETFYSKMRKRALVCVFDNHLKTTTNNTCVQAGIVTRYDKSRLNPDLNGVEIGFFILAKTVVAAMSQDNFSFEEITLRKLIEENQLAGFMTDRRYYSLGNHDTYYDLCRYVRSKKTIFLDRDGVINKKALERGHYITSPDQFEFMPGAVEGIKILKEKGYRVLVLTNQAGIERGAFTEEDLEKIHDFMLKKLKENGTTVDKIYHCPHDWNTACACRKPGSGMMLQAAADFDLSLRHVTFVGDDRRDMMLGDNLGCKTLLFKEGCRLDEVALNHIL